MQTLLFFWLPALFGNPAQQELGVRLSEPLNWDEAPFESRDDERGPAILQCSIHPHCHLQHELPPPRPRQSPVAQQAQKGAWPHGDDSDQPDLCLHQLRRCNGMPVGYGGMVELDDGCLLQLVVLAPGVVVDYCRVDCCRPRLIVVAGQDQGAAVGHGDDLLPGCQHHAVPVAQECAQQGSVESESGHQVLSAFCVWTL